MGRAERVAVTFTHHHCTIASQWEAARQHRELRSVLGDGTGGCGERAGGSARQRGTYAYIQPTHAAIQQKLTNIVRQLSSNKKTAR